MEQYADHTLTKGYEMPIVLAFIKAVNNEDFNVARRYLWDYMKFTGVLTSRDGAENYLDDLRTLKPKYNIKKAFIESTDVCLLYDLTISGITLYACGWYQVVAGKISAARLLYDPRPLLDLIPYK